MEAGKNEDGPIFKAIVDYSLVYNTKGELGLLVYSPCSRDYSGEELRML
jgi:hypothetical protein